MRLTAFLIMVAVLRTAAIGYSQTTKIKLSLKEASLESAFQLLHEQTGYDFFFVAGQLPASKKVTVNFENTAINKALDDILTGTGLVYRVINKDIIITKGAASDDLTAFAATQQQKNVSGTVVDGNGVLLPGVTVIVKGSTIGTITDADGNFTLQNVPTEAVLTFSFVGMRTREVPVEGRQTVHVIMEEEAIGIEEVVAVGYGYVRKSDLTGTVSSVNTEKTMDIPNTNVLQTLQGSVAGLNVTTPDRPGENPAFIIRGRNSISAGNTPLIVVDGIIYNGSLNDFNVNDIEKIDILKDASAAAVYGSRSANGVIIVTTKMGTNDKPMFNFNAYYGISNPVHLIPVLDGPGYIRKILDFRSATGQEANPDHIEDYLSITETENYRTGKTIDWYDKIIKTGITQNYNLNISGKTEKTNYYLSGTYYDQTGIVENDDFDRLTLKANFINKITDWYSVSLRTAFSSLDYSGTEAGLYYGLSPYGTYWEDESRGIYKEFPMEDPYYNHPLINTFVDNKDIRTSLLGTISSELDVPFIKGLKWTLNYSTNLRNRKISNFWDNTMKIGNGKTLNGHARKEIYDDYDWTLDNIINYKRTLADKHSIDLTVLYSREYARREETIAEASDFFNQALGYNNLGLAKVQETASNLEDQNSVAYMARLNYVFDYKYSLTATVRRDGFSGFAPDNKYATFPSVALAWTISNEGFMESISSINLLKIRVSYGENGNQALGRYQTLARIKDAQYVFGDGGNTVPTVFVESMANTNLGWETTKVKNIGIDFGIFRNRISGTIDAYLSNTYNILLKRNIPGTSGYNSVWTNIGKVHNHGIELALNSENLKRNNYSWETGFTFALNRNRIDELFGEDLNGDGKEDDNVANSWFIGKPLGVIYGYKTEGIWQSDDNIPDGFRAGDFRLADTTGEGELTPEDRTILGSTLPSYTFSVSNNFRFRSLSLYVLVNSIQGGGKDNYYVGDNMLMHNVNTPFTTYSERFNIADVPYWTPENPSNEYARINYIPNRAHPYLEDRSFVRLQDVTLAYTFDKSVRDKLGLQDLRLYASGKNLYTWTKWTGYDPETMSTRGDGSNHFPMLRTFTLGIDLRF